MKAIFLSKTSMDQHPLNLMHGWLMKHGNDAIGIPLKPFTASMDGHSIKNLLDNIIKGYRPDVVVAINFAVEMFDSVFWYELISNSPKTKWVFWSIDDPFKLQVNGPAQGGLAKGFHLVITCDNSKWTRQQYKELADVDKVIFGVPPAPQFIYREAKMLSTKTLPEPVRPVVMYAGNPYNAPPFKIENTLSRVDIAERIAPIQVEAYGHTKFKEAMDPLDNVNWNGYLPYRNIAKKISGSTVVNPHVRAEADYLNARFFEAAAAGCPQVVERKPCIEKFMEQAGSYNIKKLLYEPGNMAEAVKAIRHVTECKEPEYRSMIYESFNLSKQWTPDHFFKAMKDNL